MFDSSPPDEAGGAPPSTVSPVQATFVGWLFVALWNVGDIASLPARRGGLAVRLTHHAVDLGHVLAVALVAAAGAWLWKRVGRGHRIASALAVAATAAVLSPIVLSEDLRGALDRLLSDQASTWLLVIACMALSQAVTACFVVGRLSARPRVRWVSVAGGVALVAANGLVLENGYPGAHVLLSASGATLASASLEGASWGRVSGLARKLPGVPRSARIGLGMAAGLLAATSVVRPPPNAVQIELFERDTPLLVPWLRALYPSPEIRGVAIPPELLHRFESRATRADLPPPSERFFGGSPIVVMITIDALRPDVLGPRRRRWAPNLHEIRANAVYFAQARSTASDTRYSMATLFSGLHHSMLKWGTSKGGKRTLERDQTPRLPELLAEAGVETVCAKTVTMMDPRQGIVRGFAENLRLDKSTEAERSPSDQVATKIIERLRRQGAGPLFVYTHLMDPHDPYETHGKQARSKFDAYLMEVSVADENVGRIRRAIHDLGLKHRTALIIGADHGEAFGEHGLRTHGKAFYDVMVHIPMMIELPNVAPRTAEDFVSLMDLAPTVLDLFGVPTPGSWMAETLTPILAGRRGAPNRLILMEEFSQAAMLFPDGLKVMKRRGTVELYDVLRDPKENDNLWDDPGGEGTKRLELLEAYVRAHAR